ncbi:hypothetical protein BaRGS_00039172 [Batillaria attramentaria]|uniref:Uncharacterized protein n=1 Tax=Batillaria attramentaria TaxID=370345 RepID=A0ABD0J3N2_9CAEN
MHSPKKSHKVGIALAKKPCPDRNQSDVFVYKLLPKLQPIEDCIRPRYIHDKLSSARLGLAVEFGKRLASVVTRRSRTRLSAPRDSTPLPGGQTACAGGVFGGPFHPKFINDFPRCCHGGRLLLLNAARGPTEAEWCALTRPDPCQLHTELSPRINKHRTPGNEAKQIY